MRVIFMGTSEFAVPPLDHLMDNYHQVVAVYTQPDKPAGRGRSLVMSPVKKAALARDLPVIQPISLREPDIVKRMVELNPDAIVLAAFGQILPQAILDIPKYGGINIHPSLLPRFRGASPVVAAILAGDAFAGVSIMVMDEGLDTGPILARTKVSISPRDTAGSLTMKLSQVGARLIIEFLPRWLSEEITPQPQDESQSSYSKSITKEDGEIIWQLSAVDIWRRVRAFQPWPGCYTWWRGKQLKIIEAVPLTKGKSIEAGLVVEVPEARLRAAFGVCTGDGTLGVLQVQMEGKRALSAGDFLRGQRQFIGAKLPT